MQQQAPQGAPAAGAGPLPRMGDLVEQNVRTMQRIEDELQADNGSTDRLAQSLHDLAGQGVTLWLHLAFVAGWVGYNSWPGREHFDPFPFTLLALVMAVEAILLAILILVSQRNAARVADRRSRLALQINLLSEQEATRTLRLLQQLAQHFDLPGASDADTHALQQPTEALSCRV